MINEAEITLKIQQNAKRFSSYLISAVTLTGTLVLIGWNFDIDFLKRLIPGLVAMNPATAISFLLISITIILYNNFYGRKTTALLHLILGILIVGLASSCLLINVLHLSNGFDQWFFTEKLKNDETNIPNTMAPNTAINFILTGLSLLFLIPHKNKSFKIAHVLIFFVAFISMLSIVGYVYGVRAFYGVLTYIPMALNTTICFLLVSGAVILSTLNKGIVIGFNTMYVGSMIARKLIPAIIIIPILLGLLIIYGEKSGLYTPHFGMALFTVANILILVYLVKQIQNSVNRADIARTEAEQKLKETNDKLMQNAANLAAANIELEAFSYSISHDLKTLLIVVEGFAQLLKEDYANTLDNDGREYTERIINGSRKMRLLIDDLLAFARSGKNELKHIECNMSLIVKNIIADQDYMLKKHPYVVKISELEPCFGDPQMLQQVWVNLISNAIKYSSKKEHPLIEIGSVKSGEETMYFVKDNGDGFDMDKAHKLFLAFQRLHENAEFEGTGIGLAIAHKIIIRHSGKIWAESKKNEGACFYFSIPIKS